MKSIIKGIKDFFRDLNFMITTISLSFVYFFGVGLTFLLSRIFGKHFLDMKPKEDYWEDLNLGEKIMEEYYKQY